MGYGLGILRFEMMMYESLLAIAAYSKYVYTMFSEPSMSSQTSRALELSNARETCVDYFSVLRYVCEPSLVSRRRIKSQTSQTISYTRLPRSGSPSTRLLPPQPRPKAFPPPLPLPPLLLPLPQPRILSNTFLHRLPAIKPLQPVLLPRLHQRLVLCPRLQSC